MEVRKKYSPRDFTRAKKRLDISFAKLIRKRDAGKPCIDNCGRKGELQCGHFRRRELMSTRWNPRNSNGQVAACNAWFDDGYLHAIGIDARWGAGTTKELHAISRKVKQWSTPQVLALIAAGEKGLKAYEEVYKELTKDLK